MRMRLGGFLWLLMSVICTAAEIVAWKVPLGYFAWNGLETEGVVRCEAAPEASPFFKDGDELWLLNEVSADRRIETASSLEWVIWNATSRTLVTKSDLNGIWQLHRQLRMDQLPKRCRLSLEVFEVPSDGSPLSDRISPLAALSWVFRSGQKFEASHQLEGKAIAVQGSAVIGENSDLVDLVLKASCVLPNQPGLDLATSVTLRSGDPMWIARDFDGNKGLDIRLTGSVELVDGTPSSEAIRIQKGQMTKSLWNYHARPQRSRIGDMGWLASAWFPFNALTDSDTPDMLVDPFAEPEPENRPQLPDFNEVEVPEILRPWIDGPVWDMREVLKDMGLGLENENDFAGYDPLTQTIFLFTNLEKDLDMFEALVTPTCIRSPAIVIFTFDGIGQTRLATRSGQIATIIRPGEEEGERRSIAVEPTVGENADLIDLRLKCVDKSRPRNAIGIETCVVLNVGDWSEISAAKFGEGEKSPLRVKAELFRPTP